MELKRSLYNLSQLYICWGLLFSLLSSRVVTRRHEQIGEHGQLVLRELLLVVLPVVLVGPLELLQGVLDARLK